MDENNDSIIVASFPKNNREAVCVGINQYKGQNLLFIRAFAQSIDADGLIPTPSGISLSVDKYQELLAGMKAVGDVMSSEKVVAIIHKNETEQVWIGLNIYKEIPLLYVRTFIRYKNETEFKPTKKGVSMRVELYPKLLEAVEKLGEEISAQKL